MTTWNVFGDSISLGYNASSGKGYVDLVSNALGLTVSNGAVSGAEAADQAGPIFAVSPGASFLSSYFIGMNDQRHWGLNANNLAAFEATVLAEALWLSVAKADMILSDSGSVTYSGGMGSNIAPVYGPNYPRYTDTQNEGVSFSVTGNSIYVITIQQDGSGGQEEIIIDGVSKGVWNVAPPSSITTALGASYSPKCYHFDVGGLITDTHSVTVKKYNATGAGSRVYFKAAWANGMARTVSPYPKLVLSGPTPCTAGGYDASGIGSIAATRAYDAVIESVRDTLAADSLAVSVLDLFSVIFPGSDVDTCHPIDGGHANIGREFWKAWA